MDCPPLLCPYETHLQCRVQFSGLQHKNMECWRWNVDMDMELLEQVQK